MDKTAEFAQFVARREAERERAAERKVTVRAAVLPGDVHGLVFRVGLTEKRAFVTRDGREWTYGRLVGQQLIPEGSERLRREACARARALLTS